MIPIRVVAYCRVSTSKDEQLNSLETQKRFFDEYAKKYNLDLIEIYADEGISGTKTKNRKQFIKMLEDAKNNLFDIVVVKDISRLARNTVDFLESIRILKSYNIDVQFVSSNMKTLGDSEFILTIFAALAQEESANISKRIKFGKDYNAKKGRVPNIVYGYDKIKGDYFNLNINIEEADIVKRIFSLYTNDGYGTSKIANILNNECVCTKRGCRWTQNTVIRILKNEIYIGQVINKKEEVADFLTGTRKILQKKDWIVIENKKLIIIEKKTFDKANSILKQRKNDFNLNKKRHSNNYLLSALIECECCKSSFRRTEYTYKNTYVKWRCAGRSAYSIEHCNNKIVIDENEIIKNINNFILDKIDIKNLNTNIQKSIDKLDITDKKFNKLKQKILNYKNHKEKYREMYCNNVLKIDELKEYINKIDIKIKDIEQEIENINYNVYLESKRNLEIKKRYNVSEGQFLIRDTVTKIIKKIYISDSGDVKIELNNFLQNSL